MVLQVRKGIADAGVDVVVPKEIEGVICLPLGLGFRGLGGRV